MTDGEGDGEGEGGIREALKRLPEWLSVLAALLYAFGWVFGARLYGRFNVSPEEVGFNFSFLLVRIAFIAIVFAVIAAFFVWIFRWLVKQEVSAEIVKWALRLILAPPLVLLWSNVDVPLDRGPNAAYAFMLFTFFTVMWVVAVFGITGEQAAKAKGDKVDLAKPVKVIRILFLLTLAGLLIYSPFFAADKVADRVAKGEEVTVSVLPGISGLKIELVQVSTNDEAVISPSLSKKTACVHLLGGADGTTVLYAHEDGRVLRLPQGRLDLEQPCDPCLNASMLWLFRFLCEFTNAATDSSSPDTPH
jgi:hypothetical protein